MPIRTRITQAARQRGTTAAAVARQLDLYPSNISAMDAGARAVSLRTLSRIARMLDCGLEDLVEVRWGAERPVYRAPSVAEQLAVREAGTPDGVEKGWVHTTMLAWQRHAGFRRHPPP